jgi:DNA-directed RNA polymerase subunit RPC12/RpoP
MSEDYEQARCPNCGSCQVIPLLGTLPGAWQPYDTADVGRIPAAQCEETEMEGDWECEECGHKWSATEAAEGAEVEAPAK